MKRTGHLLHAFLFLLLLFVALSAYAQPTTAPRHSGGAVAGGGLAFTENRGQIRDTRGRARPDILYLAESHAFRIYLTSSGVHYLFDRIEEVDHERGEHHHGNEPEEASHEVTGRYRMDMELLGANPSATVVPGDAAEGVSHYYLAHAPEGINGVRSWRHLVYRDIYPNIDMTMRVLDGNVKCDFIVRPGGDPSLIRMKYSAADRLEITPDGALRAVNPLGALVEEAPFTYIDDPRSPGAIVSSRYRLDGDVVSFEIGGYDRTRTLVIDPIRKWSTFYGGSGTETLSGGDPTEVDRNGNVLVAGYVDNNNFPVSSGAVQGSYGGGFRDAILIKFDGNGRRLWATYYGGSQDEIAHGVVTDASRNVFLAGHTSSTNFPVQNAYQGSNGGGRDAFVVKFDSNGSRLWATYYGGNDFDDGYGFGGDSTGNVAVLLTTGSAGMATDSTFQPVKPSPVSDLDALLVKFTSTGNRVWATYYGGNSTEYGYAVGSDPSDNIIITGWTFSTNFPTTAGAFQTVNRGSSDAFIVKFNRSGNRQWATYYGGNGRENDAAGNLIGFAGLATDGGGNIFITGFTTGGTFPVSTGAFQTVFGGGVSDAFIVKMNANGIRVWATFVGGNGEDVGTGIASNPDGGVLGTGFTASTNFPVTGDAYQRTNAGGSDAYIMKLSSVGIREWGTYYGGAANDEGHGISFDPFGSMVVAGHTSSTNFPTLNAYQATKAAGPDAFALLFCDPSRPRVDSSGPHNFCPGDSLVLWALPGYSSYRWSNGSTDDTITIKADGDFFLTVTSVSGCIATSDTIRARVRPRRRPVISPAGPYRLCQGDTVTLDAGVALSYRWSTGATTQKIRVNTAGDFKVFTVDINGCRDSSELMTVAIFPKPDTIHISPRGPIVFCEGDSVTLTANTTSSPIVWSTGERTRSITVTRSGTYRAVIDNPAFCYRIANEVVVKVNPKPRPTISSNKNTVICEGDSVTLTAPNGFVSYRWSTGATGKSITVKTIGNYTLTVTDTNGCTGSSSELVNVTARPIPRIGAAGDTTFCEGDSVQLVAESGYARYLWSNGAETQRTWVRTSGTYTVQAGTEGCLGISNGIRVTVIPLPMATPNGPDTVCPNTDNTYEVPAIAGATYLWSVTAPGSIRSGQGTNSVVVRFGTSGGRVSLTVNDPATTCRGAGAIDVGIGTGLSTRITPSRTSRRLCPGDTMTLDAGPNFSSYRWARTRDTGTVIGTERFITVRDSGTYEVVVSNGGCKSPRTPITISLSPAPVPVIGGGASRTLCPGDTIILDAGIFNGGYRWSTGARTQKLVVTRPGTYSVTVTNTAGCTAPSPDVVVTAGTAPQPAISGSASVCAGSEMRYCVPETPGNVYTWRVVGGNIISGGGTSCVTIRWGTGTAGSIELTERLGANGCDGESAPFPVAITSGINPTIAADGPTTFCSGDSVTLEGPAGFDRYEWSNGATSRSIVVTESGTYRLNVFAGAGCTGSSSVDVNVGPAIDRVISPAGPLSLCQGESITLRARTGYSSYLWSTGERTSSIVVVSSGSYSVLIADASGCEVTSQTVAVTVNPLPATPSISRRGDTLTATPGARYQWLLDSVSIPGGTSQTFIATSQGEYRVRVTDANGCSALSPIEPGVNAVSLVMLPMIEATPGEKLSIPLSLLSSRNLDNVGADEFRMTLRFNKTLLLPTGSTPLGTIDGADRVIAVTGQRASGITTGAFSTLDFIAALGDTSTTALRIESFEWVDGSVFVERRNGEVRIKPNGGWRLYIPDGRLTLLEPKPNPVAGVSEVELVYETIEPGRTQLYLVDMLGRLATTIVDAELTPTRYTTRIDIRDLASGTYWLILQTPTERLVQPLHIQK